jgi:hypothetical protein
MWKQTSSMAARFTNLIGGPDGVFTCGLTGSEGAAGARDTWIVDHFDANGRCAWEQTVGGPGFGGAASGLAREGGLLYVGGMFDTGSLASGGQGTNPGIALLDARTGHIGWTKWETADSYGYAAEGVIADTRGVWLLGNRTSATGITETEAIRYDGSGVVVWRRMFSPPPGYRGLSVAANQGACLAVLLTPGPSDPAGSTLAMGIDGGGSVAYRLAPRMDASYLDSPRDIGVTDDHRVFVAAQSSVAGKPALTITNFQIR